MHFLITAGGTREYIDPVRFISNASTGTMGYCLARAALRAGHPVTLITGPTALRPPAGSRVLAVTSARDMFAAVKEAWPVCDCLIMSAAVSDYTVADPAPTKIKKTPHGITLALKPTQDILRWAGKHKKSEDEKSKLKNRLVVGFALEDRDMYRNAEKKLQDKNLDMIVANTPAAIGAARSRLHVKTPSGPWQELPYASKAANAQRLIRLIETCQAP